MAVTKREVLAARCAGREGAALGAGGRAVSERGGGGGCSGTAALGRAAAPEAVVISGQAEIGPRNAVRCFERGRKKVLMTILENLQ